MIIISEILPILLSGPDMDCVIIAGGSDELTIGGPGNSFYDIIVACIVAYIAIATDTPDMHCSILAAGSNDSAIMRHPGDGHDSISVAGVSSNEFAGSD